MKRQNRQFTKFISLVKFPGLQYHAKKIETTVRCGMERRRMISSTHAPMFGLRGCVNFFGQGSSTGQHSWTPTFFFLIFGTILLSTPPQHFFFFDFLERYCSGTPHLKHY